MTYLYYVKKLILIFFLPLITLGQINDFDMSYNKKLTKQEKEVIINKGTEHPFSGEYNDFYEEGTYNCKACDQELYKSNFKFKSNCGWPSFDDEIEGATIKTEDNSFGMRRIEICCSNCNGHLGHLFYGENYTTTNTRHCVNSISLNFKPK